MNKPTIIHRKKLFDGKTTARELFTKLGIRKKCDGCGSKNPVIRIRMFCTLQELTKRQPEFVAAIAASNPNGPYVPTVKTEKGELVKIGDSAACALCQRTAERAAAKAPGWVMVDIDRGPDNDKPLVQVSSDYEK